MEEFIQKRIVKSDTGQEFEFPFVVVDAPEKWPEASTFLMQKCIPNTRLAVNIRGVSYASFEEVSAAHNIPPEPAPKSVGYQELRAAREDAILGKEIALIELSTGTKIPGETTAEKIAFLRSKGKSEVQGMITFIQDYGCCWDDGNTDSPLINQYLALQEQQAQVVNDSPFSLWSDAKDSSYSFVIQRPHDGFITEFQLRGISGEKDQEIRRATDPGEPGCIPYKDPRTGRTSGVQHNPNDLAWIKKANRLSKKALLMYIEATMPFTIPGTTDQERADWIGKRLVGDVAALKMFIDKTITSYGASMSFF